MPCGQNDQADAGNPFANQIKRISHGFDLGGQIHQHVGGNGDEHARA
jgi:hypothetical protein